MTPVFDATTESELIPTPEDIALARRLARRYGRILERLLDAEREGEDEDEDNNVE